MEPDSTGPLRAPESSTTLRVDDQIVRPETREEMVRGRRIYAAPAKTPHADLHSTLDFVTSGCIAPGYVTSTDLLTRAGPGSDFATDTCIRREGIDPRTGARHLEELAFEIVNEQSRRHITERAQDLSARGVRRLIAIFVKRDEVCEWSPENDDWVVLDPDSVLEDPTLAEPLPIRALLDHAEADKTVARGLRTRGNPEIRAFEARARAEGQAEGRAEGQADATRTAIGVLCDVLDIELGSDRRMALEDLDAKSLQRLLDHLHRQRCWPS